MNNAEYMKLLKAQREKAKLKEAEVIEALKIEDPAEDTADDNEEVTEDAVTDGEVGTNEQDQKPEG